MPEDRRREPRWRSLGFVLYRSGTASGEGQLLNVSETGLFVRTSQAPLPGEEVRIFLQGVLPQLELLGQARWAGRRLDGAEGFGADLGDPPLAYVEFVRSIELEPGEQEPRRIAPRVALTAPVAVEFGTSCDEGTLCDISLSGARLERTRVRPSEGAEVTLCFSLVGHGSFEVRARVARQTESGGYAVCFEELEPAFKDALERATHPDRHSPVD